ncbi:DegV family protein [Moraxella oblonga]|uniref:DegV family protein n=1 Tax=Moraxella oblonga TaxID=200413 RepID=UPI00082F59E0|nr:DegV family protein [Moraxella oblonga]
MKRVVVSTSSSSLNYINAPHNIRFIPFHIFVEGKDYLDIRDIDTPKLSKMIRQNPSLNVKTSPATEQEIFALFEELRKEGYTEVFLCTISSAISNSHAIFDRLKAKYVGHMDIYVYDTKTLNIDEGVLAFEADLMMQEGKSMLEIINRLDELRQHSLFMFTLSDLDFIIRSKKLSAPAGFVANLFGIKPVMWVNDEGLVVPKDKIRKIERSMRYMIEEVITQIAGRDAFIYIADTSMGAYTEEFKRMLANEYGLRDIPVIHVSTVSLANHGTEGVGIGVYYGEVPRLTQYLG